MMKRLAGIGLREMGHVNDTESVKAAERIYGCKIAGFTASWRCVEETLRVYVRDSGVWRGPYILSANDIEMY